MDYHRKIDGLRFVAVVLVIIEHFAFEIGKHISAGWYGVDLFFVISGFLITSILLKLNTGSVLSNYLKFIGRRTLRIFPIYYISLLILWLLGIEAVRENLEYFLTYTFNYAWKKFDLPNSIVNHYWSLSVEEQFYLFWPFVVLSLNSKRQILLFVIFIIVIVGFAQMAFNIFPQFSIYNSVGLLTRMSSLGIGALGAVMLTMKILPWRFFTNTIVECGMFLFLIILLLMKPCHFKTIMLPICSLYLVLKAAKFDFTIKPIKDFLSNRWVVYIGTLSYGIYLYHVPIDYFFTRYIYNVFWSLINFEELGPWGFFKDYSWAIKFPFSLFLTVLFASLSFKYIETPFLKLKNKYFLYQPEFRKN